MSSGWGEQPASESAPEPAPGSAPEGEGAAAGGSGGGVLVPVLIIVVVLVVLGGGAAAFLLLRPDKPDPNAGPSPSLAVPSPIPVSSSATPEPEESPTPEQTAMPEPPAAPVNTGLPQVTGTATVGQLLTTTKGTWQDESSLQFGVAWASCASLDSKTCVVITGSTNDTYVVNAADEGKYLLSVVTAVNAGEEASQVQSGAMGPATPAAPEEVLLPALVTHLYSDAIVLANQVGLTLKVVAVTGETAPACDQRRVVAQKPVATDPLPTVQKGSTIEVTITRLPNNCRGLKLDPSKTKVKEFKDVQKQPGG